MSSDGQKPLPILIIPGFMSSGLEIRKSKIEPSWEKKRVWINLTSLGFESLHTQGILDVDDAHNSDDDESSSGGNENNNNQEHDEENPAGPKTASTRHPDIPYKSMWMQHMCLRPDMRTERDGVQVRPIAGCPGADYLSPGTFTSLVSYVFGPLMDALREKGYQDGVSLDAATYDWRLAPADLESRDGYFTNTLQRMEEMYKQNGNTPIVLLCHSLGCKTGRYLLEFALQHKGEDWIRRHVHTYMPVGAPHLGAPKALRSAVSGDKMGLEAFLSDGEALALGRSLGSGPWLIPPTAVAATPSPMAVVQKQGTLHVTVLASKEIELDEMMSNRYADDYPSKVRIMVKYGEHSVFSSWFKTRQERKGLRGTRITFSFDEDISCVFATNSHEANDSSHGKDEELTVCLCEEGITGARRLRRSENPCHTGCCVLWFLKCITCYCLWGWILRLLACIVVSPALMAADSVANASGHSRVMAVSDPLRVTEKSSKQQQEHTATIDVIHRKDVQKKTRWQRNITVTVKTKVHTWNEVTQGAKPSNATTSSISAHGPTGAVQLPLTTKRSGSNSGTTHETVTGKHLMDLEGGMEGMQQMMDEVYEGGKIQPRALSSRPTGVPHIRAVYGINLPSEVGAVFKRREALLLHGGNSSSGETLMTRFQSRFVPDESARMQKGAPSNGIECRDGVLLETKATVYQEENGPRSVCGDGTVPYWSLRHVKEWQKEEGCEVTVDEVDGAEHREILADPRFHEIVIKRAKM